MSMELQFPVYVIPFDAGYVSVVDGDDLETDTHYLAVFTSEELANAFMAECQLGGQPRPLHNAREFAWLLRSLRAPVASVAFDPSAEARTVKARWQVSVQSVLDNHLVVDFSPWNYPVFVIEQRGGFASIEGEAGAKGSLRAVSLFTTAENADQYLQEAGETGVVHPLEDMSQTRAFLGSLSSDTVAVALDPRVNGGVRSAHHCFSIDTVLDRYLVTQRAPTD